MRLGILSDTHNALERTRQAVARLRDERVDALIHCGDLSTPSILGACAESQLPCHFVFGNHDADNVQQLRQEAQRVNAACLDWGGVVELCGKRIGVAHGHMTADLRKVLAKQPHVVLYGHTHLAMDHRVAGVRRINPGALFRAERYSVAVLDLETDLLEYLDLGPGVEEETTYA